MGEKKCLSVGIEYFEMFPKMLGTRKISENKELVSKRNYDETFPGIFRFENLLRLRLNSLIDPNERKVEKTEPMFVFSDGA